MLGLYFGIRTVQATEVERAGPPPIVLAIDEWENTLSASNGTGEEKFLESLAGFVSTFRVRTKKVSLAIHSSRVFIHTIPVEPTAQRSTTMRHLKWELGQYFPDTPPEEFTSDVHELTRDQGQAHVDMLSVSVRRREIQHLSDVLARVGMEVEIVDVDHFAAETALKISYPDTVLRYLALVGITEGRLDISYIRNGTLESYAYRLAASSAEIAEHVGAISRDVTGLNSVVAYGTLLDKDLLVLIRKASATLVEALNPLRRVGVSPGLRPSDRIHSPSYRFAAVIGAAVRRD
jgi:hypothetical protein